MYGQYFGIGSLGAQVSYGSALMVWLIISLTKGMSGQLNAADNANNHWNYSNKIDNLCWLSTHKIEVAYIEFLHTEQA